MGMQLEVTFAAAVPAWPAVAELVRGRGFVLQMRMIDGELAFPDDVPPDGWRELRVAAAGAMVTVRRADGGVQLVVWGNADADQQQLWRALAWGFAQVGDGRVQTEQGPIDADTFAAQIDPA
ncbi:MAG: hypothetical protein U0736_15345 [Gemmataceae bacterium]